MVLNTKQKLKKKKKKKKTARVICHDLREYWTTQTQFWQWVRQAVVIKTGDAPLTGMFAREHEELLVVFSNTILNLAHPNHIREALLSRRVGLARKRRQSFAPSSSGSNHSRIRRNSTLARGTSP